MSNYDEAEKLGTDAYQELMAKGILEGILAYLESNTQQPSTTTEPNVVEPGTVEVETK